MDIETKRKKSYKFCLVISVGKEGMDRGGEGVEAHTLVVERARRSFETHYETVLAAVALFLIWRMANTLISLPQPSRVALLLLRASPGTAELHHKLYFAARFVSSVVAS